MLPVPLLIGLIAAAGVGAILGALFVGVHMLLDALHHAPVNRRDVEIGLALLLWCAFTAWVLIEAAVNLGRLP